jgi:hypothetical protein
MYIEREDLRKYLGIETTEVLDDDLLEEAIVDAQSYIESETNRRFESITVTRYYDWDSVDRWDKTLLHLDADLLAVTTLTNGDTAGTAITPANYWPMPRNEGPPYNAIKLKENAGIYWEFDTDCLVSVYGPWGYSNVPPGDIRRACTVLAAYFYKAKDSQVFETTAIPEAGVITIPEGIAKTTERLILRYKKYL